MELRLSALGHLKPRPRRRQSRRKHIPQRAAHRAYRCRVLHGYPRVQRLVAVAQICAKALSGNCMLRRTPGQTEEDAATMRRAPLPCQAAKVCTEAVGTD